MPMQTLEPRKNSVLTFVLHYLKQHKLSQIGFFFVSVCWAIELTLTPYLLKRIIDVAVHYNGSAVIKPILWPCAIYALMTLFMNLNFRLYDLINLKLYPILKAKIGQEMFDYLIPHSYDFFQRNFAGTLTKKIFDMSTHVEKLIQIFNEWFYPRVMALIVASVSMWMIVKPIFGIVLFLWTFIYILFSFLGSKWTERYSHDLSDARARMSGTISDAVSNILLTKLFANMTSESNRVAKTLTVLIKLDKRVGWAQLLLNFIQGMMVTLLTAIMLILLVHFRSKNLINAGDFAFILTLSMFVGSSVWQLGRQMLEFSKSVGECRQALSYLVETHAISDKPNAPDLEITQGHIQFKQVSYSYVESHLLFEDLTLDIHPGEKIGLVGPSGGGKSTFMKLILRLMDVQQGKILIDGQDIRDVRNESLRQQIASIPQETELFHRTVLDNILFARHNATFEEVITACRRAHCHDFILNLPKGYDSLVGERGVKLSGGQKQRIAIARAFLKNAPVILLDEATSALDSVTEKQIQVAIHEVMSDKTAIVAAHRLSTLKDMDRILVFDQGKLVQDGTLTSLLKDKNGIFHKLWDMQSNGFLGAK